MSDFLTSYPNFDWRFYINAYDDLRKAGINNEQKAIQHFIHYGYKENRRTHQIIHSSPIISKVPIRHVIGHVKQCSVSDGLLSFRKRFMTHFQCSTITSNLEPCVFFGIYMDSDLQLLQQCSGLKYIIWGGEDANGNHGQARATLREVKLSLIHI